MYMKMTYGAKLKLELKLHYLRVISIYHTVSTRLKLLWYTRTRNHGSESELSWFLQQTFPFNLLNKLWIYE